MKLQATRPVEIGFGHRLNTDNSALSQLDTKRFGNLFAAHHLNGGEHAAPDVISAPIVYCS
jgi:hypothetical protein